MRFAAQTATWRPGERLHTWLMSIFTPGAQQGGVCAKHATRHFLTFTDQLLDVKLILHQHTSWHTTMWCDVTWSAAVRPCDST
jgi:hypothetical protein